MNKRLAYAASGLFLLSLFLPAMRIEFAHEPAVWIGYQVALSSIAALFEILSAPNYANTSKWGLLLSGTAALFNLIFIIAPIIICYRPRKHFLISCGLLCCVGLFLSLIAPLVLTDIKPQPLFGYWIWVGAFSLMLIAIWRTLKSQSVQLKHDLA